MNRRNFFHKTGCGLAGIFMAYFGLTSCKKKGEEPVTEKPAPQEKTAPAPAEEELSKTDKVKKLLVEKMGKTQEEAEAMIAEFEEKLPMVKNMCICKNCPSYVADETELGFCHPLVGKSKIITEEKGCICPTCPVYREMGLKNGYYCTRKSELEQESAKAM